MERETALAQKLRRVDYDLTQLTDIQRTEIFALARSAQVELWRPGQRWPSSEGAYNSGEATQIEAPRP